MRSGDMPLSGDMAIEYSRQVERVNRQLRRLRKAAAGGRKVLNYAYKGIMLDIKEIYGEERLNFSTKIPSTVDEYRSAMNAIKRFYDRPTSTLSGFRQIYKNRAETLTEKYGVKFTADELMKIFESGLWDAISEYYGSETTMEMVIEVKTKADEIKKKLSAGEKINWSEDYAGNFENIKDFNGILERYLKGNAQQ